MTNGIWNLRRNYLVFLSYLACRLLCWSCGNVNMEPWVELHLVILSNLAPGLPCCTSPVVYIQRQQLMGDLDWLVFSQMWTVYSPSMLLATPEISVIEGSLPAVFFVVLSM